MKNLFTHRVLPDDDESYVPFENPYLVSRISPEVEAMMHYDNEEEEKPKLTDGEKDALKAKEKKVQAQAKEMLQNICSNRQSRKLRAIRLRISLQNGWRKTNEAFSFFGFSNNYDIHLF